MILRATIVEKKDSWGPQYEDAPRVVVRLEIDFGQGYFNTGLHYYNIDEWNLICALLILGARETNKVNGAGVDLVITDPTKETL